MESLVGFTQGSVLIGQAVLVGRCAMNLVLPVEESHGIGHPLDLMARASGMATLPLLILLYLLRARTMLDLPLSTICTADGLVMLGTRVGQALQAAFLLTALATIMCWSGHRSLAGLVGFCAIATTIPTGHIAAQSLGFAAIAAMTFHLLLATAWFGCLPALLFLAWTDSDAFLTVLRRFSRVALPAMACIVVSGALIAVETVGSWPRLFATHYGMILIAKFGCIVVTLAAAFGLRRALASSVEWTDDGVRAKRLMASEVIGATTIVLAAAILAQQIPSIHEAINWPYSFRIAPSIALKSYPDNAWTIAAVLITAFVLLAAGWALMRRRRIALAAVAALAVGGEVIAWGVPALSVPAYPTTYAGPVTPYTAHVIASGARIYAGHCEVCHGRAGHGDGPAANGMVPPPADLAQAHTTYHTMGDMYWWVSHGYPGSAMPGFAESLSDHDRWAVITYVMTLSLGYQARLLGPEIVLRQPWLHAIEFSLGAGEAAVPFLATTRGRVRLLTLSNMCGPALEELRQAWSLIESWKDSDSLLVRAVIDPQRCGVPASSIQLASLRQASVAAEEIASSWSLFRRSLSNADEYDTAAPPEALVFLIDRFGFVRARWRSDEEPWPPKPDDIIAQSKLLAEEPEMNRRGVHDH
jgi:putative copper export protein/mono/diheme cytochrome c family protein